MFSCYRCSFINRSNKTGQGVDKRKEKQFSHISVGVCILFMKFSLMLGMPSLTTSGLFGYPLIGVCVLLGVVLARSSWHACSMSARLLGCLLCAALFKSIHGFSVIFKSGGKTFTLFLLNPYWVVFALCFGLLPCWRIHCLFIFSFVIEGRKLCIKIFSYLAAFILHSFIFYR